VSRYDGRSRDDPFLARVDCDYEALHTNPHIHAIITAAGGHIGFIEFKSGRLQAWAEPVAADWHVVVGPFL
jgi:predicted alpha/beta-fold hydrolase